MNNIDERIQHFFQIILKWYHDKNHFKMENKMDEVILDDVFFKGLKPRHENISIQEVRGNKRVILLTDEEYLRKVKGLNKEELLGDFKHKLK